MSQSLPVLTKDHCPTVRLNSKKGPSIGAVVKAAGEDFVDDWRIVSSRAGGVLRRLAKCGTGAFGYELHGCGDCSGMFWKGMNCKDSFCPDCGLKRAEDWRMLHDKRLLPIPYDQVVIGLPNELRVLCQENRALLLDVHLRCCAEALKTHSSSRAMYRGMPAITQVLHTWDRRARYYVHGHHLISRGGWNAEEGLFICSESEDCPLDPAVLRTLYLQHMVRSLKRLRRQEKLSFEYDGNKALAHELLWTEFLNRLEDVEVYIHAAPCEGGPRQTLAYLSRSLQQGVFAHIRLDRLDGRRLAWSFMGKDGRWASCIDDVGNFLRQIIRHIPPKGFHRVRYYGLASSGSRAALQRVAALYQQDLDDGLSVPAIHPEPTMDSPKLRTLCPHCKSENTRFLGEHRVVRVDWRLSAPVPMTPHLSRFRVEHLKLAEPR